MNRSPNKEKAISQTRSSDQHLISSAATQGPASEIARRLLVLLLTVLVFPAALASLFAKSADIWWFSELFVHFKIQYLVVGLLCIGPAVWLRRWATVALCALCILINAYPVAQYFGVAGLPAASASVTAQANASVRVASLNVWFGNTDYESVATWIEQVEPDVAVLVEAGAQWQEVLARRLPDWPHQHLEIIAGKSGKMILSRHPFESVQSLGDGATRAPLPIVTISVDGARLRLGAVHTHWPIGETNAASRNRTLADIAKLASSDGPPFIAAGDFNVSPFSPHFQDMLREGRLVRTSAGYGWLPTWPHFLPPASIQIDHILVVPDITVSHFEVHAGLGSDHHGIVADLDIPKN